VSVLSGCLFSSRLQTPNGMIDVNAAALPSHPSVFDDAAEEVFQLMDLT
jgi:hypothetical protein